MTTEIDLLSFLPISSSSSSSSFISLPSPWRDKNAASASMGSEDGYLSQSDRRNVYRLICMKQI